MYSKPGCHLCDDAWQILVAARAELGYSLERVNIETDDDLMKLYGEEIPVVTLNEKMLFKYHVDAKRLAAACRARRSAAR